MLTYAVGDTHGCLDPLRRLLAEIEADAAGRAHGLVFLGDGIDRGPDSAGVVATLRRLQAAAPNRVVCLLGNHEALLLAAWRQPEDSDLWLRNGGDATLASYGVRRVADLPQDVLDWMASCPTLHQDRRRVYVHAGLRPGIAIADQRPHDLLWIRDAFLESETDFGPFVVHGHTPRRDGAPDLRAHRVNLDTAAVFGGRLTAGVFEDGEAAPARFLQVAA